VSLLLGSEGEWEVFADGKNNNEINKEGIWKLD
jgi:hypothetical protein